MTKAQRLVNDIDSIYGFDVSALSDREIQSLIDALTELKDLDRDDVIPPSELEMDSYMDEDFDRDDEEELDF